MGPRHITVLAHNLEHISEILHTTKPYLEAILIKQKGAVS